MEGMTKKKGKEGTRGTKQIAKENAETINFYRNMILGANGFYFLGMTLLGSSYKVAEIAGFLVSSAIYIACYHFFTRMGSPQFSEPDGTGALLSSGLDLNIEGGMAEHVKDAIIVTSAAQMMALVSNYMWLLLLLIPLRLAWMAWSYFIHPWIFAPAAEPAEGDEKKQKKMERKMKRFQR